MNGNRQSFTASAVLSLGLACAAWAQEAVVPSVQGYPFGKDQKWLERYDAKRALAAQGGFDVIFLGDSITRVWADAVLPLYREILGR